MQRPTEPSKDAACICQPHTPALCIVLVSIASCLPQGSLGYAMSIPPQKHARRPAGGCGKQS